MCVYLIIVLFDTVNNIFYSIQNTTKYKSIITPNMKTENSQRSERDVYCTPRTSKSVKSNKVLEIVIITDKHTPKNMKNSSS